MQSTTKATLKVVLGIFLIVFGIAGMILPILPGWWVALIGLQLLGLRLVIRPHQPWLKKFRFRKSK